MNFKFLPILIFLSKLLFGSLFIQTVFLSALFASSGDPQDMLNVNKAFISIELKDASLQEVFRQIESKTDFTFSYEKKDLDENVKINLQPGEHSVAEILRIVSRTAKLKFKQVNSSINVSRMPLDKRQSYEIEVMNAEVKVTGRVVSADDNEGIPGVNIRVKGTSQGVITDFNGEYTITVPSEKSTLVFSYVGFLSEEVVVGSKTTINVVLKPDVEALTEVVVVGYGTQQKAEVTGAVASISAEKLKEVPVVSFENAIQGKVAGVDVAVPSGEPGAAPQIRIRGTGSISAGNDPLYVIDGLPISKNSNLQADIGTRRGAFSVPKASAFAILNPNDIESIEILKDASAAAIYGSRASNGVVLVTTKKGNKGEPRIDFNAYSGIQNVTNRPDLMNAQELIAYTKDARNNNYLQSYDPLNPESKNYNPQYDPNTNAGRPNIDFIRIPEKYVNWDGTDTDWLDEIFTTGSLQSYNISVSGGSDNFTYYTSGGYYNEKGIVEGSEFDRFTFNLSLANKLSENIQIGANLNLAFTDNDRLPVNAPYFANPPGIVYAAMVHSPVIKPYNEDGTPNQKDNQSFLSGGTTTADNPLAIIDAVSEKIRNYRTFGNVFASYNFLQHFTFKTYVGIDVDNYRQSFYRGNSLLYRGAPQGDPFGQSSSALGLNWIWENTVNYSNKFEGGHNVNAIVGYSAQRQTDELNLVYARNFPDDQVTTVSGGIVTGGTGLQEEWSLVSALARVNYSFKEKYLFTGTIRSDRSSRFGADNQTGIFPSASVGWRLTSEPFMSGIESLNELKLRASYGVTGNFEIPNYGAIGLLNSSNYILNNQIVSGVVPKTLSNRDLSWETTRMLDIGLDLAFLKNRIYGSLDYYVSRTSDLLLFVTIPSSSGFQSALTNIGEVENRGFEASLTSRNLVNEFRWETDFNFSTNKNKVLALGPDSDEMPTAGAAGTRHITRVGDPIGSYYGHVVVGIYQSEEEIRNAPKDMMAPNAAPGDFRFADVNGDGKIDSNDRTVLGSYYPDFTFGITNRFNYKRFDMSVFIQGVEGREVLNLTQRHLLNGEANFNSYADYNNRWRSAEEPGDGTIPRADRNSGAHGNNFRPSSFQVEDGSYVRLRNLNLGYTIPSLGKNKSRLRIYASGTNLYMWTKYRGFNPEVNLQPNSSITPGEDYGAYPLSTTYLLGVNLSF